VVSFMFEQTSRKSLSLVALLLLSSMAGLITLPSASAVNETTSGVISGTETWTGTINLVDDVTVAEGSKLIINAGTTVNIPYGAFIDVEGAICIGSTACGASAGSASNQARFIWSVPSASDYEKTGRCFVNGSTTYNNGDAGCGSGMVIRKTIDQSTSATGINYAHFENAYGYPIYVSTIQQVQYGVLVFDGSSTTATGLSFKDINTSNVLAIDFAAPTLQDSTFNIGVDGNGYDAAAVRAYGAGAGILATVNVRNSVFTGDTEPDCSNQGGGRVVIFMEESYINLDNLEIKDNSQGVFLKGTSGWFTNSTIDVKCNAIDTNSHKETGTIRHTLNIQDNIITTAEGAGVTAYDDAIVVARNNVISGAAESSGFGIRSSTVDIHNNVIGPIGGWNGLWIYGTSDVVAENNTIQDTAKEAVLIGEYHFNDQGWNVPTPTAARLYLANNQISNNTGTCNSQMYGGDFACPAVHVFMSSATVYDNTITNNAGDGFRVKGGIINAQRNTVAVGGFAANITMYDDNYGNKYGSIGYFSGNSYTNASQVYNITESRVTVQSEYIPDPGAGELYPVSLQWLGAECPYVLNECLQVPSTAALPPAFMPMALEVVENSTVFSYADLQNFDASKVHVQNQNSAWGSQVREGELVRYQVKAQNSNVVDATVVISDATGLPLYTLQTDAFGFTPEISLPSDFYLDRNWNHLVGESNVEVTISPGITEFMDENTCSDGYDNDGDTFVDDGDTDCTGGRELPFYSVNAFKFGKGTKDFDFVLSGGIDDVINLDNLKPSVDVAQGDGASFATVVTLTGTSWDGIAGPYPLDIVAYEKQFGLIKRVEIQPPGSTDWYSAVDTSGAGGEITLANHPFKTWSFDWDLSAHPEGEGDVTFRVRSYDGLDYSPIEVRKYKLNLVAPTILIETPNDGTSHGNAHVTFTGTASDPYSGTWGSDIESIWFDINGPNGYTSHFAIEGSTAWSYEWQFEELDSGTYTFEVWAADSDFCIDAVGICNSEYRTLTIMNDNALPFVSVSQPIQSDVIRASAEYMIQGVARDNDGQVTRVEIDIQDLASGLMLNNGPNPITNFAQNGAWATSWDTSKLIHDQQYELVIRAYDGEDYSVENRIRITIDNPTDADNIAPIFNQDGWAGTITVFCDANSNAIDRCGQGAVIDLTQFFSDPDGTGEAENDLLFDIFDDATNLDDDFYADYVSINAQGVATYNPPWVQPTSVISEWSLVGLMFEARDSYDSVAYSYKVNVIVVSVAFSAERVDSGAVSATDPATFSGQGLPNSMVAARFDDEKGIRLNSTRVGADGTWSMDIARNQMSGVDSAAIIFEMDGQVYSEPGTTADTQFQLSSDSAESGSGNLFLIIGAILGVLILLGAGAFFFQVEYEEIEDGMMVDTPGLQTEEDPYAWAKAKQEPVTLPQQQVQPAPGEVGPAAVATPAAASTHPGWLWDEASNSWVPDPNYSPEQ
jgi:hypothetical protein